MNLPFEINRSSGLCCLNLGETGQVKLTHMCCSGYEYVAPPSSLVVLMVKSVLIFKL